MLLSREDQALIGIDDQPFDVTSGGQQWDFADYPDGALPEGWTDAADSNPTVFDPMAITDGTLGYPPSFEGIEENFLVSSGYPGAEAFVLRVGHGCAFVDIGRDDNFELNMEYWIRDDEEAMNQVGPLIGANPTASNIRQLGLLANDDYSVLGGAWYFQNEFTATEKGKALDPLNYDVFGPGTGLPNGNIERGVKHWIKLRAVNGKLTAWFSAMGKIPSFTRPSFVNGRTKVGIHALQIQPENGTPKTKFPEGNTYNGPSDHQSPVRITKFAWHPYDIPL